MTAANGLISAATLAQRLGSDLSILDARSASMFEAGHIPGAINSDYAADGWRARVGMVPGLLPGVEHLAGLFSRLGLAPTRAIILVPAGQSVSDLSATARMAWTLDLCGYRVEALLDGGMTAWMAAGLPVQKGAVQPVPGSGALHIDTSTRATATDVAQALADGRTTFVDARSRSYFDGQEKAPEARAAGHLPGAVSVDYASLYDPAQQRLRPRAELARIFSMLPTDRPVISYCNTGHTAALNWFVLSRVLDRADVRLYDGSMTDWTQDESRPVVRGG
ncbi:MAG TPA: sulfurtransferase [Beijerinckiaceae bacterium]|nr:sulfurtransferase [Beijerinckiaceae bacterium]